MGYSVDKDKAYAAAKKGIESIHSTRQSQIDAAVQKKISKSKWWNNLLSFVPVLTEEQALNNLKAEGDSFNYYTLVQISYGRSERALENIKVACENCSSEQVIIDGDDFHYLKHYLEAG